MSRFVPKDSGKSGPMIFFSYLAYIFNESYAFDIRLVHLFFEGGGMLKTDCIASEINLCIKTIVL